jgi:hypothetical protein
MSNTGAALGRQGQSCFPLVDMDDYRELPRMPAQAYRGASGHLLVPVGMCAAVEPYSARGFKTAPPPGEKKAA